MVSREDRERIERRNRELLDDDLLQRRLTFASSPYHAHVQFSNFCNMSCVMCWDGGNPPLQKMSPEVLGKVADQVAPGLSVITPHDGSEPLLVSWDEARRLAEDTASAWRSPPTPSSSTRMPFTRRSTSSSRS